MDRPHGRSRYLKDGCRCAVCRQAASDYQREWRREQARLAKLGRAVEKSVRQSKGKR